MTKTVTHDDLLNLPVVAEYSPHKRCSGVVRKVGEDFLLIDDSVTGTALIPLEHVKQLRLSEATPAVRQPQTDAVSGPVDPALVPDTLCAALQSWAGSVVQLDGGGPDPYSAYLLDVRADYVVASVIPEGLVYIPIRHIHLVRPLDVVVRTEFSEWVNRQKAVLPAATRFADALRHETGRLVKVGRGGPDEMYGIVRAVHDTFVELVVSPHELVRIPMHHVKSFSRQEDIDWQAVAETTHA
ncbi:hypothetical protein [Alicyclobacillus macrosporangiidus]|uniref:hypothetical protein n=1 Tax=Alicyclobacillus macrosporangiidus TaxID=392015 RepID=UPI0012DBFA97|nr:hypothetical protein [Alicyclobacillus macrosporangiidus]